MMTIEDWNNAIKPREVDIEAIEGDLTIEIGGYFFLIQRKYDFNNVLCFKYKEASITMLKALFLFREFCLSKNVQYVRVEGSTRRYKFLQKISIGEKYRVLQDMSCTNRNIFYVQLA